MSGNFPRSKNGLIDNGEPVKSTVGQLCPNCGSEQYMQTISSEDCPECGLHFDYWGEGANQVYQDMMHRRELVEAEDARLLKLEMEEADPIPEPLPQDYRSDL